LFAATPPAGGREEIYQIGVDGTNLECVTCGVSTNITANLFKPVPFQDDSGRVLVQTVQSNGSYTNAVLEDGPNGKVLASGELHALLRGTPDGSSFDNLEALFMHHTHRSLRD